MTKVLNIDRLRVDAGNISILRNLNFALYPGELCAVIGPSGAGKSTLIKTLLGLRPPDEGVVTIGGQAVSNAGPVGYVPQIVMVATHAMQSLHRCHALLILLPQILFSEFVLPKQYFTDFVSIAEKMMPVHWSFQVFQETAALETDWLWLAWSLIVLYTYAIILAALTALALIPRREI